MAWCQKLIVLKTNIKIDPKKNVLYFCDALEYFLSFTYQ